jgi:hypothetical protein
MVDAGGVTSVDVVTVTEAELATKAALTSAAAALVSRSSPCILASFSQLRGYAAGSGRVLRSTENLSFEKMVSTVFLKLTHRK